MQHVAKHINLKFERNFRVFDSNHLQHLQGQINGLMNQIGANQIQLGSPQGQQQALTSQQQASYNQQLSQWSQHQQLRKPPTIKFGGAFLGLGGLFGGANPPALQSGISGMMGSILIKPLWSLSFSEPFMEVSKYNVRLVNA